MDEIVKQALAKWPNVPHCTGWLLLDRRGQWRMRDDAAQAAGELGTPIRHEALLGFINRNYESDAEGQWFFQNGPQRVYVELAYTPWILRLHSVDDALRLTDQAGAARVAALHDHDLELFANHASLDDAGRNGIFHWRAGVDLPVQNIARTEVAKRFGFVASPAERAASKG